MYLLILYELSLGPSRSKSLRLNSKDRHTLRELAVPHVGPLITAEQLVNEVRARLEVNGFASSQVQSLALDP